MDPVSTHDSTTSMTGPVPPLDAVMIEVLSEVLFNSSVEITYSPADSTPDEPPRVPGIFSATAEAPGSSQTTIVVSLQQRVAHIL